MSCCGELTWGLTEGASARPAASGFLLPVPRRGLSPRPCTAPSLGSRGTVRAGRVCKNGPEDAKERLYRGCSPLDARSGALRASRALQEEAACKP